MWEHSRDAVRRFVRDKIDPVLLWVMGRPRPPRGEHVATSRANALRFVCERVDKLFPASKYDIRDCGDIIELARSPTSSLTSSTAIVHFRPVLETVPVGPISKLASYKTSLGCPAVFVSWLQDYSDDAIALAESNEILLYRLEPDGSWIPQNKAAEDHDKKNSLEAPPLIAWLSVVLVLTAIGALYFGPLILFSAEKLLRKALGFSGYIETVAVIGAVCLGVLFSLIWGQASGRAWRWPASAARSVIAFGVLVVNIVIIFACVYLARSEQYPGSFSFHLKTHMQALYFSSTTLATVGYGDITPTLTRAGDWAQGAVLIEMAVTLSIVGVAFAGLGSRLASRV